MIDLEKLILATSSAQTEAQAEAHLAARRRELEQGPVESLPATPDEHDYAAPEAAPAYAGLPPLAPPRPAKEKRAVPPTRPRLVVVPKSS